MNAVSTTHIACCGKSSQPTTKAAASATAIWTAMRVLAGRRRDDARAAAGARVGGTAVGGAGTCGSRPSCHGPTRSRPSTSRATATQSTAIAPAPAVSRAASHAGVPESAGATGTTSTAVSGRAMRAPSRAANGPKRRSQIGMLIPAM